MDHLNNIGISVSYSRVTQVESNICLQSVLWITWTIIRHSSQRKYHLNTGISIIQFPTSDSDGNCQTGEASSVSCSLPHSYTMVPAVSLLNSVWKPWEGLTPFFAHISCLYWM